MSRLLIAVLLLTSFTVQAQEPGPITVFGDSIMHGSGVNNPAIDGVVPTVGAATGWTMINKSVSATLIADEGQTDSVFATPVDPSSRSLFLTGYNNMRTGGIVTKPLTSYRLNLAALVAWLAVPDTDKLRGTSPAITYTGSWQTVTGNYGDNLMKATTTIGDSASASVEGSAVYITGLALSYGGGSFDVKIDGVSRGTYSGNTAVNTPMGRTYAPFLVRIAGLADTKHAVKITQNGAGKIYVIDISSNRIAHSAQRPEVWLANCLRMTAKGYTLGAPAYNRGSDRVVSLYNSAIRQVVNELSSDGLNVHLIDVSAAYIPEEDVYTDETHPSANGAARIAAVMAEAMTRKSSPVDAAAGPRFVGQARSSVASQTISGTAPMAITGSSTTFVAPFNGTAVINADFDVQGSSPGAFTGSLRVNGTPAAGSVNFRPAATETRASQCHKWVIPVSKGLSYTVTQYGAAKGTASFKVFGNSGTGFTVTVWPAP